MKKIKSSTILKIIILFLIAYLIPINSYVTADSITSESSILGNLDEYAQKQGVSGKLTDMVGVILGVFQTIGSLVAIIWLIILGVKYMMGSVEERAEYKKTLIPYILGAIMVFGISNLLKIIYEIVTGF